MTDTTRRKTNQVRKLNVDTRRLDIKNKEMGEKVVTILRDLLDSWRMPPTARTSKEPS